MYAIIKAKGHQYRVSPGDSISVDRIEGAPGTSLDFTEVLMVGGEKTVIGSPLVSGAKVSVIIENQFRSPKVLVFKKRRRQKFRKMRGHRSELTKLFVSEIVSPLGSAKADTKPHVLDPNREKKERKKVLATADDSAPKKVAKKATSKTAGGAKKKKTGGAKKSAAKKKTK